MLPKEVFAVPSRPRLVLRDQPPTHKYDLRVFHRLMEVQARLLHVILQLVISRLLPLPEERGGIDGRIGGLESRDWKNGWNPLLYEGILIAENKDRFLRRRVGA